MGVCNAVDKWTDIAWDGRPCKRFDGWDCSLNNKEGVYDVSEGYCVICNDNHVEIEKFKCGEDRIGDYKCESACGASFECDEKIPNGFYDTNNDGFEELYCNSQCESILCTPSIQCAFITGRLARYCHYVIDSNGNGHWGWGITTGFDEDGNPWQECFDGYDNDCDGKIDCADPGCAGVRNPNTGEVCCQSDSDCPPKDNVKGKCINNICQWPPCSSNADCVDGTCCTADRYGPSPGAPNGVCVGKGIYSANRTYLCDPPTWKFNVPTTTNKNVFESILGFFSHFFFQR